ncbi:hypothetical protein V498_02873 [Pseudogymnoascus sp. VKM F-4517 (FW-2822)]|nr:hypothetical protein V498_02873 [Pseudogymnoascus sp. VKM F-4517 (FW-2822)]
MKPQTTGQKRSIRKLPGIRSRKSLETRTTTSEEGVFRYSKPLEEVYPKSTDSFTILPCRVGLQDDGVRGAVQRLYADSTIMKTLNKSTMGSSIAGLDSPFGHFASLIYPECIPERLEIAAMIVETGTILDDILDDDSYAALKEDVGNALMGVKFVAGDSPLKTAIEKWVAIFFLEMVGRYGKEGRILLRSCQSGWLGELETTAAGGGKASSYEDYLTRRIHNFAMPVLLATAAFSIGASPTAEENKLIQPLTDIATRIAIQTNDYFGWKVDRVREKDRTFNGITYLMVEYHLSEEQAMARLKCYIMQDEQMYVSMLDSFYKSHPDIPTSLRKYVTACTLLVGGNHQWSAVCPRYNPAKASEKDENAAMEAKVIKPRVKQVQIDNPCAVALVSTNQTQPSKDVIHEAVNLDSSALLAAPRYIQSLRSKNIRGRLVDAFNIWFQLPEERVGLIKAIINDIHNASLLLDDIQDDSTLRRGSAAAHCIFGPAQCINSATYMVVQAATRIHHTNSPQTMGAFLDGLTSLSVGQSWDLNWKFNLYCPSVVEYMAMIDGKTGAMFQMLVRLMESLSSLHAWPLADFDRFTQVLGRWYQVRDDFQNIQNLEYTDQKGFCEDLDEGKLSYPVVICCNSDPTARAIILGIFRQNRHGVPLERSVKMQILDLLRKTGALDKTWQVVQQLEKEVEDTLSSLETLIGEPNPSFRFLTELLGNIPPP